MARPTSGDRPVDCTKAAIAGQQESIAPASGALEVEQTLADGEQTLSDADQTSSDSDQTSADGDQLAAARDQAASDRVLASGGNPEAYEFSRDIRQHTADQRQHTADQREHTADQREQTAQARLEAADQRDAIADARDLTALARDDAAADRSLTAAQGDDAIEQEDDARGVTAADRGMRAAGQRKRAAASRTPAPEQRALAAEDRQAAAHDREQGAHERRQALLDRQALARQLAITETDPLTRARTRAAGLTDLDNELERCRRSSSELVAAYVDVVGLKTVNDTRGHGAGDELLKRVVVLIKEHLRPYDLIIRLGGDEFLCAMSNMTLTDARRRFGAIAAALATSPDGGAIRTGFAELTPDLHATELIARADGDLISGRCG